MHTETDAEARMRNMFKWNTPRRDNAYRPNYKAGRGTVAEYDLMRKDCAAFKQAMQRQLPAGDYNRFYSRVEQHCRKTRPFKDKPYSDWLGILQAVWSRALAGELPAIPHEYNESGVQHCDIQKIQAIAEETTVKTKKPKIVKPPKKDYNTVGVRFLRGHNLHKVYTYKVPKKVKLHLGEEIVVPTEFEGLETNSIAAVVELHSTPRDDNGGVYYKWVSGRIQTVKA